jgi:drug/metabolite transporter (DMT)-like permease
MNREVGMSALPAILAGVLLAVAGQLLVKHGINLQGGGSFAAGLLRGYLRIYSSPWVLLGSGLYAVSILFWVYSLSRVPLSFAYPFVSLSYVLVILASRLLLGEAVPPLRWLGVAVICAGILLVSRS